MKVINFGIILSISIILFLVCTLSCSDNQISMLPALDAPKVNQWTSEYVFTRLEYIKDSRTGLCFAYSWGGSVNGGPVFTCVPCSSIPERMLKIYQPGVYRLDSFQEEKR